MLNIKPYSMICGNATQPIFFAMELDKKENFEIIMEHKESIFKHLIRHSENINKSFSLFLKFLEKNGYSDESFYKKEIPKLLYRRVNKYNYIVSLLEYDYFKKLISNHDVLMSFFEVDKTTNYEKYILLEVILGFGIYKINNKIESSDWLDEIFVQDNVDRLTQILVNKNIGFLKFINKEDLEEFKDHVLYNEVNQYMTQKTINNF